MSTLLLIIVVIVSLYLPNYWQTRMTMEKQLQSHLTLQLEILSKQFDIDKLQYLQAFQSPNIRKEIEEKFHTENRILQAESLFLFDEKGLLLAFAGNRENALKTLMLHSYLLSNRTGASEKNILAPVFDDDEGNYYLSIFKPLEGGILLGISASAEFLQHLATLRQQMVLTAILIIGLALIMALIFSSSLAKPLHRLTLFAKDIGRGKSKIPNPGSKTDEISLLYNTMIEMQQKIQKREKENKQIVASVAHELRNPIAGMQINSELLLEKVSSKEKKYSMAIYQELKKMANIVDSFLNYSRPIDANMESSDLVDLLEEILSTNSFDQNREQIKISGNAVVDIHKSKMKHVFTNLIQNALEAGEEGGVVEILIQKIKTVTQITIKNSGKPIDSKNRSQIFEAFFSTKENGVGLGLPIAKSIVEQHGGDLFLEKSDESGTFFVVTLPGQKTE